MRLTLGFDKDITPVVKKSNGKVHGNQMEPRLYIGRHSSPIFGALRIVSGEGKGAKVLFLVDTFATVAAKVLQSPVFKGVGCIC